MTKTNKFTLNLLKYAWYTLVSALFFLATASAPVFALDIDGYQLEVNPEEFSLESPSDQDLDAMVYFFDEDQDPAIIDAAAFTTTGSTSFTAGYCSGEDCIDIDMDRIILKIEEGDTINSYWLTYDNDDLSLTFDDTSQQLDLDDDESQWLQDPSSLQDVVVTNPDFCSACGLDIALVIDSSGSISNSELNQMKQAFISFVDAFLPTTPTQFAVIEFDSSAWLLQDFSNDADEIKAAINQAQSGGMTDWQAALQQGQDLDFAASSKPDLLVFASDGQPTYPVSYNTSENLDLARQVANEIKLDNIRILTLGIGDNLSASNLSQISGPIVDQGMADSDVVTTDFDQLAQDLADLAYELCAGKILAQVQIDGNADGDLDDELDLDGSTSSIHLSDWMFTAAGSPSLEQNTDESGLTEFELDPHTYSLTGSSRDDLSLQSVRCVKDGQELGDISDLQVDQLNLGIDDTIACYFVYEPNEPWTNDEDEQEQDQDDNGDEDDDEDDNSGNVGIGDDDDENEEETADEPKNNDDSDDNQDQDDDDEDNDDEDENSNDTRQGQVLGVSTQKLPATGMSTTIFFLPLFLFVAGVILVIKDEQKTSQNS